MYDAKWRIFSRWCDDNHVAPLDVDAKALAKFLSEIRKKKVRSSTVAGYRAAIASTISIATGKNLSDDSFFCPLKGLQTDRY